HERGTHNMFTGYKPSPALVYPSFGSVVAHEFGPRADLPPYVCIPSMPNIYAGTGYLSSSFGAFSLGDDPARQGFQVRDLQRPSDVDDNRFGKRRKMLDIVNDHFRKLEKSDALDALDTTMVCVTSEFGRTPKINGTAGRDHWPKVFSIVLAGGGIARGKVYGSSDATAAEPQDNPLTVEDFATTLYHCLGLESDRKLM